MRGLTVSVHPPDCFGDLVVALRNSGCRVVETGPTDCRVVYPSALDEHEANVEIRFFVRAWEAGHAAARVALH
jgi:hypothetical protein